jgi:hypothetical protein
MPALIVYLLKVNAALCLFYLAYRFALRPLTFYYLNRFFLVSGIVFSTVYPLVDISSLFASHAAIRQQLTTIVPDWNKVIPIVQHQVQTVNYWAAPIILFWVGVVLMSLRLAVQFISLYRIHRASEQTDHLGQSFRSVNSDVNPFSFWQDIYLNPGKHTDAELRSIIQHEQIHVKQWHTLDVILAELSVVFYWFNPGVWFMKQAVKENLEFITDREILRSGVDEKVYQYSLVRVSALKPGAAIVNNFNFLTIKKRIMMMNKKRSSRANLTRYVVLPLIMLLALVFTVSKAAVVSKNISVLVKKVLPVTIISKTSPAIAPFTVKAVRDTVKPKAKNDSIRLTIIKTDDGSETDTIEGPNGKKVLKNVKVVRINGKNVASNVIVVDDKGKPTGLTLAGVTTDNIASINVEKDTAVKVYNLSIEPKNQVVVKLKPTITYSSSATGTSGQMAQTVSVASLNSSSPSTFSIATRQNDDDEVVYILDPQNLSSDNIEDIRKKFKDNGFDLSVHTDYSGKTLKSINVKISSEGKDRSSSASYSNDDKEQDNYLIKIIADKTTGSVSVMSVKR